MIALVGCSGGSQHHASPRDDVGTAGATARHTDGHFLPGYHVATEADISRGGENAPLEMREAVGAYYLERGTRTALMPPMIYAIKRVGDYELLFSGGPSKLADSEFVYDPQTRRIVGTFDGTLPGGETASPRTTPSARSTGGP